MSYSKKISTRARKRTKRTVANGIIHIKASFNNTIVTITDEFGNTLISESGGTSGFKGARKSTHFAAQSAVEKAGIKARDEFGMKTLVVYVRDTGPGRDSVRALNAFGFRIPYIKDKTRLPRGGGCRPRKQRRV